MRQQLIQQITAFLDGHESAPGAFCLVKSFADNVRELDDYTISMAYERSEGENDSEREQLLNGLSDEQLSGLAATTIEILLEKTEE